jgi:hypothetical protein
VLRRLRHLRFAAALFLTLLALALVALGFRSYAYHDAIAPQTFGHDIGIGSNRGVVVLVWSGFTTEVFGRWTLRTYPLSLTPNGWADRTFAGFGVQTLNNGWGVYLFLPHWFLATSSLAVAALFAFKTSCRFTIRGLLITTTLLAAVLGLVVYPV